MPASTSTPPAGRPDTPSFGTSQPAAANIGGHRIVERLVGPPVEARSAVILFRAARRAPESARRTARLAMDSMSRPVPVARSTTLLQSAAMTEFQLAT